MKKRTRHHSIQTTKSNFFNVHHHIGVHSKDKHKASAVTIHPEAPVSGAEAVPFLLSAIHLFQTSHINLHVNILKSMISITRICKLYLQFFLFVLYFLILLQLSMQPGGKLLNGKKKDDQGADRRKS